jgi:hypothetical protein
LPQIENSCADVATDEVGVPGFDVSRRPHRTGQHTILKPRREAFDLPLDATKVTLGAFTPGTALDPGSAPASAAAVIPTQGPLAGTLVTAQSQKASGAGAVATDTVLAPKTVLYTIELDVVEPLKAGVVFDGTSKGFVLASGGLRNKAGLTVVDPSQVKIGKLEVNP